jgi:hypothetical protein
MQQNQNAPVRSNGSLFHNDQMQGPSSPNMRGSIEVTPELLQALVNDYQTLAQGDMLVVDLNAWHKQSQSGVQYISLSAKSYVKRPRGAGGGYQQPQQQPQQGGYPQQGQQNLQQPYQQPQPNLQQPMQQPMQQPPQTQPGGYPPQQQAPYQSPPVPPQQQQTPPTDFPDDDIPF